MGALSTKNRSLKALYDEIEYMNDEGKYRDESSLIGKIDKAYNKGVGKVTGLSSVKNPFVSTIGPKIIGSSVPMAGLTMNMGGLQDSAAALTGLDPAMLMGLGLLPSLIGQASSASKTQAKDMSFAKYYLNNTHKYTMGAENSFKNIMSASQSTAYTASAMAGLAGKAGLAHNLMLGAGSKGLMFGMHALTGGAMLPTMMAMAALMGGSMYANKQLQIPGKQQRRMPQLETGMSVPEIDTMSGYQTINNQISMLQTQGLLDPSKALELSILANIMKYTSVDYFRFFNQKDRRNAQLMDTAKAVNDSLDAFENEDYEDYEARQNESGEDKLKARMHILSNAKLGIFGKKVMAGLFGFMASKKTTDYDDDLKDLFLYDGDKESKAIELSAQHMNIPVNAAEAVFQDLNSLLKYDTYEGKMLALTISIRQLAVVQSKALLDIRTGFAGDNNNLGGMNSAFNIVTSQMDSLTKMNDTAEAEWDYNNQGSSINKFLMKYMPGYGAVGTILGTLMKYSGMDKHFGNTSIDLGMEYNERKSQLANSKAFGWLAKSFDLFSDDPMQEQYGEFDYYQRKIDEKRADGLNGIADRMENRMHKYRQKTWAKKMYTKLVKENGQCPSGVTEQDFQNAYYTYVAITQGTPEGEEFANEFAIDQNGLLQNDPVEVCKLVIRFSTNLESNTGNAKDYLKKVKTGEITQEEFDEIALYKNLVSPKRQKYISKYYLKWKTLPQDQKNYYNKLIEDAHEADELNDVYSGFDYFLRNKVREDESGTLTSWYMKMFGMKTQEEIDAAAESVNSEMELSDQELAYSYMGKYFPDDFRESLHLDQQRNAFLAQLVQAAGLEPHYIEGNDESWRSSLGSFEDDEDFKEKHNKKFYDKLMAKLGFEEGKERRLSWWAWTKAKVMTSFMDIDIDSHQDFNADRTYAETLSSGAGEDYLRNNQRRRNLNMISGASASQLQHIQETRELSINALKAQINSEKYLKFIACNIDKITKKVAPNLYRKNKCSIKNLVSGSNSSDDSGTPGDSGADDVSENGDTNINVDMDFPDRNERNNNHRNNNHRNNRSPGRMRRWWNTAKGFVSRWFVDLGGLAFWNAVKNSRFVTGAISMLSRLGGVGVSMASAAGPLLARASIFITAAYVGWEIGKNYHHWYDELTSMFRDTDHLQNKEKTNKTFDDMYDNDFDDKQKKLLAKMKSSQQRQMYARAAVFKEAKKEGLSKKEIKQLMDKYNSALSHPEKTVNFNEKESHVLMKALANDAVDWELWNGDMVDVSSDFEIDQFLKLNPSARKAILKTYGWNSNNENMNSVTQIDFAQDHNKKLREMIVKADKHTNALLNDRIKAADKNGDGFIDTMDELKAFIKETRGESNGALKAMMQQMIKTIWASQKTFVEHSSTHKMLHVTSFMTVNKDVINSKLSNVVSDIMNH